MNNIIEQIKTSYNRLSIDMIEEYHRRKYMRFFKGTMIEEDNKRWPRAKVSLATACFYMGQGLGIVQGYYSVLRTGLLNRLKQRIVSELKGDNYR